MADFDPSQMSTEDLDAFTKQDFSKMSENGLKYITSLQAPQKAEKTESAPAPQPSIWENAGHNLLNAGKDIVGGLAHTAGNVLDTAQNIAAAIPGSKVQHIDYNDPNSEANTWARPFQHEPEPAPSGPQVPHGTLMDSFLANHPNIAQGLEFATAPLTLGGAWEGAVGGTKAAVGGAYRALTPAKTAAVQPAARLVQQGYKISPSTVEALNPSAASAGDVPGTFSEGMETTAMTRARQLENADVSNQKIRDMFGVQDLSPESLEAAKKAPPPGPNTDASQSPSAIYDKARDQVNGRAVTSDFGRDMDRVATQSTALTPAAENSIASLVNKFRDKYAPGTSLSGQTMMEDMQDLRDRAKRMMNSPTVLPETWDTGMASRNIADALETEMQRHLDPETANAFQNARTKFAQINDAQTALRAGSIDPHKLLQLRESGAPLSGPLADLADAAEHAPKDIVHPQNAVTATGIDPTFRGLGRAVMRHTFGGNADQAISSRIKPAPAYSPTETPVGPVPRPSFELASPEAPPQVEVPQYQPHPMQAEIRFPHEITPGTTAYEPAQRPLTAAPAAGTLDRSASQVAPKLTSQAWQEKLRQQLLAEQRARSMMEGPP